MKHGGDLAEAIAQFGGAPRCWLDLSTGINPWPWPVPRHLPESIWQRLPSRTEVNALLAVARRTYGAPSGSEITVASGTQALIQLLPYLAAPGPVAIVGPTYSEHALAWRNAGHPVIAIDRLDACPETAVHAVVVNPNNPDGRVTDRAALTRIATQLVSRGGWLVVDEAFADIDPATSAVALCPDLPVLVLRSFGKFYGLAGLRLGFALGASDFIGRVELLATAGFTSAGGTPLFRLARHPHALELHAKLARRHVWCRSFDWADDLLRFGLPSDAAGFDHLAVALRD
jgi:cobalamin biosynthetic protein CobC